MNVLDKLKQKISGMFQKVVEEYYVSVEPDKFERVEKAIRDENAELWAKVMKLEKENQQLKKIISELKKEVEEEFEQELMSQEQYLKEIIKQKSFRIYFRTRTPIRIISVVTNKPFKDKMAGEDYPYLRGLEFVDTPKGVMVYALLAKSPKPPQFGKEVIGKLSLGYYPSALTLIHDMDNLVTNLKRGVIQLNMDEYGRPIYTDWDGKIRVMIPEHLVDLVEGDMPDGELEKSVEGGSGEESEEELEQDAGDRPKVSRKGRKQRNSNANN